MTRILGVIPARFGSTRFPGKPLVNIAGKPLLEWVIRAAQQAKNLDEVIVATDHADIAKAARACDAKVVMTDPELPSGSDRVWAAVKDREFTAVLNIQGDEPLLQAEVIDKLAEVFLVADAPEMATLGRPLTEDDLVSMQTAKIVLNKNSEALYFSRFAIPFSRKTFNELKTESVLKHIGIYGYQRDFLKSYCSQGVVDIEEGESLEQLRALYLGARIKVVPVNYDSWGVDTPDDVKRIEAIMARGSWQKR